MSFLVIPAIDLMGGEVVRLSRGRAEEKTVYSSDPAAISAGFEKAGATRIHVVDLDGAFGGGSRNTDSIRKIRDSVGAEIEVGGGLRTEADVDAILELGVDYAILGTSAVRDRALVENLVGRHGAKIIVGIDAKDGKVAIEGWVETSDLDQMEFARQLHGIGVETVIATDIATDGMMVGPNLESLRAMAEATPMNVVASGGIRNLEDLQAVDALGLPNIIGAISGRAVYEGELDVEAACKAFSNS